MTAAMTKNFYAPFVGPHESCCEGCDVELADAARYVVNTYHLDGDKGDSTRILCTDCACDELANEPTVHASA